VPELPQQAAPGAVLRRLRRRASDDRKELSGIRGCHCIQPVQPIAPGYFRGSAMKPEKQMSWRVAPCVFSYPSSRLFTRPQPIPLLFPYFSWLRKIFRMFMFGPPVRNYAIPEIYLGRAR
jgi:hypothetical protein